MANYDVYGAGIDNPSGWRIGDQVNPTPITGTASPSPEAPAAGSVFRTPNWTPPPPGPNASAPRPGVNPDVVYTDPTGNGYDLPALTAAWQSGALGGDSRNARVPDILAQYGGASGAAGAKAQTFSDPATQAWEQALNARIGQLQTPYQNPGFQPAVNQLNQYLQRLNGPAFTEGQMGLMQTQALDPLEHQRSATKQQIVQRMASHGIGPGSGILEKALEDADQQFNGLRTKTQAGFATQAIGQDNQNAAMASQIAPYIAQLYQGNFNAQEARNDQALGLAGQIPATAWQRLTGANGMVQQQNPLAALQLMNGFQNQGYQQSADFSNGLMQMLSLLFGLK